MGWGWPCGWQTENRKVDVSCLYSSVFQPVVREPLLVLEGTADDVWDSTIEKYKFTIIENNIKMIEIIYNEKLIQYLRKDC